jgi:predicted PurR-regulated permease PerM
VHQENALVEARPRSGTPGSPPALSASVAQSITSIGVICYLIQPVLVTLVVSILFAFVLAPPTDLLQRAGLPRALAAFLSVTVLSAILYGITYFSYDLGSCFNEKAFFELGNPLRREQY